MSLFESVFGGKKDIDERGLGSQVVDGRTATAETKPEDPIVLGLPLVSVEAPLNEAGFRADTPVSYGANHVGAGRADQAESTDGLGEGEPSLGLPPLSESAEIPRVDPNQPPNGSIDGPLADLYITNRKRAVGAERPNDFQRKLRAEELGEVYQGTSDELLLPLPSAKEMIHPRSPDTGVTHPV
jgi:hypothetical protein